MCSKLNFNALELLWWVFLNLIPQRRDKNLFAGKYIIEPLNEAQEVGNKPLKDSAKQTVFPLSEKKNNIKMMSLWTDGFVLFTKQILLFFFY